MDFSFRVCVANYRNFDLICFMTGLDRSCVSPATNGDGGSDVLVAIVGMIMFYNVCIF